MLHGSIICRSPIIEAFAAGTPVVTTSPESIPYLVKHERTGLLSPGRRRSALAANVLRLLSDPALAARLGQNAYRESGEVHMGGSARAVGEGVSGNQRLRNVIILGRIGDHHHVGGGRSRQWRVSLQPELHVVIDGIKPAHEAYGQIAMPLIGRSHQRVIQFG